MFPVKHLLPPPVSPQYCVAHEKSLLAYLVYAASRFFCRALSCGETGGAKISHHTNTLLVQKRSLHTLCMLRRAFALAPCLAAKLVGQKPQKVKGQSSEDRRQKSEAGMPTRNRFSLSSVFCNLSSVVCLLSSVLCLLPATRAQAQGLNALTVCTDASPDGFDVVQYNALVTTNAVADTVMNRLVEFDLDSHTIVPSLAQNWAISSDGLTYTFTLRPNIAFHHTPYFTPTRPLNAQDVVFSFERMLNPMHPWYKIAQAGYPYVQAFQLNKLIRSVLALDSLRVQFTLNMPDSPFLAMLSMGFASIYSAQYANQLMQAKQTEKMNSHPIGTGPFIFKNFQRDSVVRYTANPSYFAGPPSIRQLVFAITPNPAVRLQKLKAGECLLSLAPTPQDVLSARVDSRIQVLSEPAFMTAFVAMNTQKKPFDNVLVRRAINMAFDHAAYLNSVFGGMAMEAILPYPPNTWSYANTLRPYPLNIAAAKKLLQQAGYPNGFETTVWVRPTASILNPNPRSGTELLQADLAKIGIRLTPQVLEWGELIKRSKAGEHQMVFMGWAGDNGDPDNFLSPQFSCAAVSGGTNFARYCNARLDQWITQGKLNSDITIRSQYYLNAQQWIHNQAVWLPLAHPTAYTLARKEVSGYRVNPFGRQDFSKVKVGGWE